MVGIELTPREQDILNLLCQGYSNDAIAERLVLSLGTVKWYNKRLFAKLGVNNRVQATLAANKLALLPTISNHSPKRNLPCPLTSFIGRAEIITAVGTLLQNHRLVTIVGAGGVGKTRLAIEVAARIQKTGHFTPCFVPLVAYSEPEAMLHVIADCLELPIREARAARQQVVDALSHQPTLLILDNFEHLLAASDLLIELLHSVSDFRLLVTSRERLNLYGEMVFPLEGLTVPSSNDVNREKDNDAVKLFVDRAQGADATYQPTDDEVRQIIGICRLLQGMPLAIEHAASWMHILGPAAILTEIQHGLDILQTNMQGLEPRHQSMRAVIDSSWERLTPREQHTMERLCVFQGGFRRDAAAEVAQANLDILSGLVAKSFVTRSGADRYDLHELHRQYAFEKLTASGETVIVREQHARFFESLVRHTAPQRWNMEISQLEALDRLDEEYANLRAAIQWSLQEQDGCIALSILGCGAIYMHDRGHGAETLDWTRAALKRCGNTDSELCAKAYFALALQDPLATDDEHRAYLDWANRSGNLELIAVAYWQCGDHAAFNHAYTDAREYYEHALELASQTDYHDLCSIILSYMGQLAEKLGDVDLATGYYRDSYEHMRTYGVRSATRPRNLGRMMLRKGDEAQARELFRIAIDNAIYLGSPLWIYETLCVIAAYLREKGDMPHAVQLFAVCYALALHLKQPVSELQGTINALRDEIEPSVFDTFWAMGEALSTSTAIGLAQQVLEGLN